MKKEKVAEPADKPGSVVDSHSSRRIVTDTLEQPTRTRRGQRHEVPIWSCSRWGLPCRSVARLAVRSYRTVSPLPRIPGGTVRRSALCCTFRRLAPPRCYLAPCPVEPGLSSAPVTTEVDQGDATAWPTPPRAFYPLWPAPGGPLAGISSVRQSNLVQHVGAASAATVESARTVMHPIAAEAAPTSAAAASADSGRTVRDSRRSYGAVSAGRGQPLP
ncbi:hypothetical protein SAMN02745674_02377 [Lysobacter spongiicola DSM 21749]|uniref:Uncharacterized protein n=1 Tax=Lysobacter spongiicola DSM 21749 TaxID=1122188 RepID=A0A1T4RUW7_9GAMM|nr:hypothetical protein SAMN02745674_02377 [Lysobacter spongiicola DSM 21749]